MEEYWILILDFDVAKFYNFGYSYPMTKDRAYGVQSLIFKETGRKFPVIDCRTIGVN